MADDFEAMYNNSTDSYHGEPEPQHQPQLGVHPARQTSSGQSNRRHKHVRASKFFFFSSHLVVKFDRRNRPRPFGPV